MTTMTISCPCWLKTSHHWHNNLNEQIAAAVVFETLLRGSLITKTKRRGEQKCLPWRFLLYRSVAVRDSILDLPSD